MERDFGYQDFTLVRAGRAATETAVAALLAEREGPVDAGMGAPVMAVPPRDPVPRAVLEAAMADADPLNRAHAGLTPRTFFAAILTLPGRWRRLGRRLGHRLGVRGRDAAMAGDGAGRPETPGFAPRPDPSPAAITRAAPPAYAAATQANPPDCPEEIRVSTVAASPGWVLVEHAEAVSGMSLTAHDLSTRLADTDVLYFRRSGAGAAEAQFDFHVYRDGDTLRRVLCHETHPYGDPAQAWWEGIADGAPTRYEPAGLYDGVAGEHDLLTGARIAAILESQGLSVAMLFATGARREAVLFARGGATPGPTLSRHAA
ncbi:MAG: hypothetical protein AAFV86_08695 [Pseudomonadota bacterium]